MMFVFKSNYVASFKEHEKTDFKLTEKGKYYYEHC